jgi:hypothetical protein
MKSLPRIAATAVTATAVLLGAQAATAPAEASVLATTGTVGPTRTVPGNCIIQDAFGTVTVSTQAPVIYAANYTAGAGNDSAWVRWRSVVIDNYGGQTSLGWSAYSLARDNAPAAYSGAQVLRNLPAFVGGDPNRPWAYRLRIEIQWWSGNVKLGASWNATDSFTYFKGGANVGGYGDSCVYLR